VAEHNNDLGNRILNNNTRILARKSRRLDRFMREVVEMYLRPNNSKFLRNVGTYFYHTAYKPTRIPPTEFSRLFVVFKV
jgi:hypothetical protein